MRDSPWITLFPYLPCRSRLSAMRESTSVVSLLLVSFILSTGGKIMSTSFNFTSFASRLQEITFEGSTFLANGSVEINSDVSYNYGRATYSNPVHLWDKKTGSLASFTTNFSFSVIRRANQTFYADGFAFFLLPVGYAMQPNTTGRELTLFSSYRSNKTKKAPVVAVEFDTLKKEWVLEHTLST